MKVGEPLMVDGTPAQVRERLEQRLCVIGELWLPTRGEMKRWDVSPAPLYLRWTRAKDGFEIGPRLETMPASRLAPALRGTIRAVGTGRSEFTARVRWPRSTFAVLLTFTAALLAWGGYTVAGLSTGQSHLGWLAVWGMSTAIVHGGAFAAWRWGRGQLLNDLPWLGQVLASPMVEGEDW
ncbi:MAG: hypothetical protein AB8H79_08735 [Myxococcota bacterium]